MGRFAVGRAACVRSLNRCVYASCRCELVPVSMDHEGLLPAHLDELMTQRQAAGKTLPR